jgi:pimeloyl-ACP methyl ester carboxylesterase
MATFVLTHGSFHGGWCWERVVPILTAAGHRVHAPDLPGRGGDRSQTLDSYARAIADLVAAQAEPVVLVGHSMGGVVITQAAELVPEKLTRLVYVCAFLPQNGQSLRALAQSDGESALMPALVIDEKSGLHWVKPEGARNAFYHDCADGEVERALPRLCKESLAVVGAPVAISAERFGRVPRLYIECTEDRALGPSLQKRMHAATHCFTVQLPSSHSPFYSQPEALASILLESA